MLEEILAVNVFAFLLVFTRMGTAIMILPAFSAPQINTRTRLIVALAFAFILTPILAERLPGMPGSPWMLGILLLGEVIAGAILGTIGLALASSVQVAGTIASFVSTLANSLVFDPVSQQQSAIIAGFYTNVATLLIFVTDLHHMMLGAIIDSYALFEPGVAPLMGDMVQLLARTVSDSFKLGVQLAAPFIAVAFAYYLILGVMTRLAPQIPVFFVGMPLQILLALAIVVITTSAIMLVFLEKFREGFSFFSPV